MRSLRRPAVRPLDPENLRLFTEDTLQRLVDRSGWSVLGRDDLHSLYSEHYEAGLHDGLPEEMIGALEATAQAVNPNWSVTQFVWALEPRSIDLAPGSYSEAVSPTRTPPTSTITPKATAEVEAYSASVGLVASETNRRAVAAQRTGSYQYHLKKVVLKFVCSTPRRAKVFRRLYERLR